MVCTVFLQETLQSGLGYPYLVALIFRLNLQVCVLQMNTDLFLCPLP